MITADDVADAIVLAIDTPPRVLIHRIEVRAAIPKKG
jgi:NADP-dependent 3-hydroxy acid dehydrogenase YdfG